MVASSPLVANILGSCDGAPAEVRVPLVALLGRLEAAFIQEFDRRLRSSEFRALSLAHSRNVLRHLGGGPRRASQLVAACDVSKQAISQQIVVLEREGYLSVAPDPTDSRARVLSLTPKGERAQRLVRDLFVEIERDWAATLGGEDFETVRRLLSVMVEARPRSGSCG